LRQLAPSPGVTHCKASSRRQNIFDEQGVKDKGSVYFTTNILVETDRLELLCCHSNIQPDDMTQFE